MLNNKKYHLDGHAQWLSNLGAAAFVIDANHNVIFWNRACELLTAVHSEEVLNTNKQWLGFYKSERACLADLVMRDNWEKNIHLYLDIRKTSNTSRGLQAHNWCNTPAGKKYLIFEANALFDEYGNIIGAVETLRDATDLKQLEEQLKPLRVSTEQMHWGAVVEVLGEQFSEDEDDWSEQQRGQQLEPGAARWCDQQ